MTTIKEIAEQAHVSAATVSNVLNGKGGASEEKTREIREVAERLNYTPNILAKNLKKRRTNTIGIITEDLTVFNTPEIVDGIDEYCEANGYEIILGNLRLFKRYDNDFTDTKRHHALLNAMLSNMFSKQVEGLVYVGYHCREITYLPEHVSIPLVYAYCYPRDSGYPSVIFDDGEAAYKATSLLLSKGHKRIGVIGGPITSFHTQERLNGYQRALFDHHILYDTHIVMFGSWERSDGYRFAQELYGLGVTAIFCFNDIMASGVYEYCAEHGITVGRGLSLIGFDNREISSSYSPKLTTIELPLEEIGQNSARLVLEALDGKTENEQLRLPCRLLERDSVSNAPETTLNSENDA